MRTAGISVCVFPFSGNKTTRRHGTARTSQYLPENKFRAERDGVIMVLGFSRDRVFVSGRDSAESIDHEIPRG